MAAQVIFPLAQWLSGTNQNSVPANDNALRAQVLGAQALGFAAAAPSSPAAYDQWIVSVAWGGFSVGSVVIYVSGTWKEYAPFTGMLKMVNGTQYVRTGSAWVTLSSFSGGTLTSALNEATPVTIASSATPAIGAALANTINITGTTAITGFDSIAAGAKRKLIFAGALVLTYDATKLILPTAANVTTAAGDTAEFLSLGSGNWECTSYQRADGSALAIASATQLGQVKVGSGLSVTTSGTLSASASNPTTQDILDFAENAGTTTGLTYGYQAGVIRSDNAVTTVAAGTVALTASSTNYVECDGVGNVTANTSGFTSGRYPLATIVTNGSGITSNTDMRGIIEVGTAGVALGSVNVFTANQSVTPFALTSGSTISVDASKSNNFKLLLATNATLSNPTNLTDGMVLVFRIKQDTTGGRTLAYGSKFKWVGGTAPTLSTGVSAVDRIVASYDATDDVLECTFNKGYA